jgi:hypothetical protein
MDVNTRSTSSGDPVAPDRTDPYSYKPAGDLNGENHPHITDAWRGIFAKFGELGEYANHYFSAKADAFKLTLRNVGVIAAIGVVGLIAASAFVVTAVVLLCLGIAHGIGALVGGHMWAGYLITGVLLLGLLAGGVMIGVGVMRKAWKKATVNKYELRQRDQRERFGHDAADLAIDEGKVDA